ncbi:MAG: nuclear transport factor 2 family protein [Betaproteobacteria bacterium]|nr:MAG: nuclear transport factor 2 family protein [Betaproteobacteria bacterium]
MAPQPDSAMPQEIRRFFEQYRDAFNALDGEAVAKLYAVPSGIAQDAKYEHWPSFETIKNNMVALCELYRKRGYESASFKLGMFLQQGEDFAVADLQWHIQWSAGQEPWDFNTTYNLVRTGEGWRVLLCTAYAEDKLFQKSAT